MSQTSQALTVVPSDLELVAESAASQEFAQARTYLQAGKAMAHGAAACMVLLGCELKRLKAETGETRGRPKKSASMRTISWNDRLQAELGISADTAGRYIDLADKARGRLPEVARIADELLSTPLAQLAETERAALVERIQCQLPAATGTQLMFEWGVLGGRGGKKAPKLKPATPTPGTAEEASAAAYQNGHDAIETAESVLLGELLWTDITVDSANLLDAKLDDLKTRFHDRLLKHRFQAA